MSIRLTPQAEALVRQRVASGRYATADEVIQAAVGLLDERERRLAWLRSELAIGEEQERRDELVDFSPELLDELSRDAEEDACQGKPVKDAVTPSGAPHPGGAGRPCPRSPQSPRRAAHRF